MKFVCLIVFENDGFFCVHQDIFDTGDAAQARHDLEYFAATFADAHPNDNVSIQFEEK